jgi:hypothetical protein
MVGEMFLAVDIEVTDPYLSILKDGAEELLAGLFVLLHDGGQNHERRRREEQEKLKRQDVTERLRRDEGTSAMGCAPHR